MVEISLPSALEMCRLGLATLIDIRQSFEIEMKGAIPDAVHIPMFEVKLMLGHTLTEDEQDILDAGQSKDMDATGFFTMINTLHNGHDHLLLCICNSGRRSVTAAELCRWQAAFRPGRSCARRRPRSSKIRAKARCSGGPCFFCFGAM